MHPPDLHGLDSCREWVSSPIRRKQTPTAAKAHVSRGLNAGARDGQNDHTFRWLAAAGTPAEPGRSRPPGTSGDVGDAGRGAHVSYP